MIQERKDERRCLWPARAKPDRAEPLSAASHGSEPAGGQGCAVRLCQCCSPCRLPRFAWQARRSRCRRPAV